MFKFFSRAGGAPTHLVVGLGNPGSRYLHTRHNAGFMAIEYLSQSLRAPVKRVRFQSLTGPADVAGQSVLLMMPQTYMNLSGQAVGEAARFYKIPPERVIILYDDKDIPLGRLRVREKGSSGGHNGIKSIIEHLGTEAFPRIRIGIGSGTPPRGEEMVDYVIGNFSKQEQQVLFSMLGHVASGVELIIGSGIREAQSRLNGLEA
ncbi:MAG: aminoacyl-tRNA hydrolase [Clostridiales bacterium]|nr:aminoacyl-tRNA hydrolase [Clostridiales bacterium]